MKQRVLHLRLPSMVTQASVNDVQGALQGAPGVSEYNIDLARREADVTLVDPDAEPDVRDRLHHAGFPADP